MKRQLLDLFCCAGGAAWGYHLAGFEVIGVDHVEQPNYPFTFYRADAIEAMEGLLLNRADPLFGLRLDDFAGIHASPPCQAFTVYGNNKAHVKQDHPNLIPATRALLRQTGLPYVIENVSGAKSELIAPIQLCGTSFGIEVRRHRLFESNFHLWSIPCDHGRFTERKYPGSSNRPNGRTVCNVGEYRVPLPQQREAMQIDWMNLQEIAQAIPPAFTEFIGSQLLAYIEERAA